MPLKKHQETRNKWYHTKERPGGTAPGCSILAEYIPVPNAVRKEDRGAPHARWERDNGHFLS